MQKRLSAGLMAAGGAVETVGMVADLTPKKLESDLCVFHLADRESLEWGNLLAKIRPDTPVVAVIPQPDLGLVVDIMRDSRVCNVLTADDMDVSRLSNVATKVLFGDIFGLEKFLPWGVRVYSMLVGDYQEKSVAIAAVSDFANAMGVRRKYRDSIEQNIDELLMNALYDAPVDDSGKKVFANVPTKTRISLRLEQKAVIQYACDGDRFAVSVRDSFGMLTKDIVLKFIDKALRSAHQIDRKEGGAGLGLYMVASSSTEFHVNLYPGVATECICIFDLTAPKVQNKVIGVYSEKIDVAGRMAVAGARPRIGGGPSGSVPAGMRLGLAAAALLFLGSLAFALFTMLKTPPKGGLAITTDPVGGIIFLDNVNKGAAPQSLPDLDTGTYALKVELEGYEPYGPAPIRVATGKEPTPISVTLHRQKGSIVVNSSPAGARIFVNGEDTAKTTPSTLEALSGDKLKVSVHMNGYKEAMQAVVAPAMGQVVSVSLPLQLAPGYSTVVVDSDPPGAAVLLNDVEQSPTTEGYILKAGSYELTTRLAGYVPSIQRISLKPGERKSIHTKMIAGGLLTIRSNVEAKLFVDGHPAGKTPLVNFGLGEGSHTVQLRSTKPYLLFELKVPMRKGEKVEKELSFGMVEIAANNIVARPTVGDGKEVTELALPAGNHQLTLLNKSTGERRVRDVTIVAGQKIPIDKW